jgi:hypothetical protein
MLPSLVEAQADRIQAERMTVVGPNGMDRVVLETGPGARSGLFVRNAEGRLRAEMVTGGPEDRGGVLPDAAGFNLFASDGTLIGRLGTRGTRDIYELGVVLRLSDTQGRARVELTVGSDGSPSIQMLDAAGNVTWRAQ